MLGELLWAPGISCQPSRWSGAGWEPGTDGFYIDKSTDINYRNAKENPTFRTFNFSLFPLSVGPPGFEPGTDGL